LNERLTDLETDHHQLMQTLSTCFWEAQSRFQFILLLEDAHQRNMMAMMVSLQRRLQTGSDDDLQQRFFTHTLKCLSTYSGRQVEMEDWMITCYEVEFGHEIGSGGLYVNDLCSSAHERISYWPLYILSVGGYSKERGTRQVWHLKYSC
jgi:hypothetical protein